MKKAHQFDSTIAQGHGLVGITVLTVDSQNILKYTANDVFHETAHRIYQVFFACTMSYSFTAHA
jgi:hypothetical protein